MSTNPRLVKSIYSFLVILDKLWSLSVPVPHVATPRSRAEVLDFQLRLRLSVSISLGGALRAPPRQILTLNLSLSRK